jgi:hypothetical protein
VSYVDVSQAVIEPTNYGGCLLRGEIEGTRLATFGYTRGEAIKKWGELVLIWKALGARQKTSEAYSAHGGEK